MKNYNHEILPKFALLLTTYNGEKYIHDQLLSIESQINVEIDIYIYDDKSTDSTISIIKNYNLPNLKILKINKERIGNAGKNFFSMMQEINFSKYDYVCFSDQDDIWKENKLFEGVNNLRNNNCYGYSSDVIYMMSNGLLRKANKKNIKFNYGHIFECISNGNTFILEKNKFLQFKLFWFKNFDLNKYKHISHEWLIYVYFIENKLGWFHDENSFIFYRQHSNNVLGSRLGFFNKIKRLNLLLSGWYWEEVNMNLEIIQKLKIQKNLNLFKIIIKNLLKLRRNSLESLIISSYLLIKIFFINK